jgi:protein involved in polysaccharide export with SLBB domain
VTSRFHTTLAGLFLLAVFLCVAAGASRAQPAGPPATPAVAEGSTLSAEEALTYKLGPGDKLRIITFDEPQLTGEFLVDSTGTVSLPLIGEVPANGRTVGDVQGDIVGRLKDGFIKEPSVSIEVLTFRPFYILGEVNKPGEYPYTSDLTVVNAVATAGGFTYRANEHRVLIKHQGASAEERVLLTPTTKVRPGDTIRVVERYF